jgi:hypothetical protein
MQQLKYFQAAHLYSMNKHLIPYLALGSLLELALRAHAQVSSRVGPKVGLSVTIACFAPNEQLLHQGVTITTNTSYRPGLEVGVIGAIGFGHFLVQPALLSEGLPPARHVIQRAALERLLPPALGQQPARHVIQRAEYRWDHPRSL